MRKLDFILQTFAFTVVGFLMLYALFYEDGIAFLYLGMFYLGFYHICHYILYIFYTLARHNQGKEHMAWYPLMLITYFTFWRLTFDFYNTETYALLMAALALTIGGYYFHAVHKKTFDFDFKVNTRY